MGDWINNVIYGDYNEITTVSKSNDTLYKEDRVSYDNYGFCIKDEQLNQSVTLYEKKFDPKRERRKKRWDKFIETQNLDNINYNVFKVMVRKGIPDQFRPSFWQKMLGSDILYNNNIGLFDKMLNMTLKPEVMNQIKLDVVRTFPTHRKFSPNKNGLQDLERVLYAFAVYFPSINYCQSINYIAAVLLLFLPPERAFWTLVQMIESKTADTGLKISGYYKEGMADLMRDILVLESILESRLKQVYAKFRVYGIEIGWICAEWFLCLFSISLPINTLLRIWDILMLEGDKILFRISFAIFKMNEAKILALDSYNSLLMYCKNMPKLLVEHNELIKTSFNDMRFFRRKEIQRLRDLATGKLAQAKFVKK